MPFSSVSGKSLIDRAVRRLADAFTFSSAYPCIRILDLGVGSGTYIDRYGTNLLNSKRHEWTGVEIWEPYFEKYGLDKKYATMVKMDAREYAADIANYSQAFDLCFVGDLAEHMTKEDAQTMIANLVKVCKVVILSIPIVHYPQAEFEGNPHEAHVKDDWSHNEVMASFPDIAEYGVENEIGVYIFAKASDHNWVNWCLRPLIAVCTICKNEEQFVERYIDTIEGADYLSICDTGSTDKTLELFERREISVTRLTINPWRFDDARNAAMMLVPDYFDLCVTLDMDELLPMDWKDTLDNEVLTHLRTRGRLYSKYHCRFQTIWDWQTLGEGEPSRNRSEHWHERIHTRHNWMWKLPVHEICVYTGQGPEEWAWLGGFMMTQKPVVKEGRSTYLPLLEQSLKEDPNVWKSWFFYSDELKKAGRRDEAIKALETALTVEGVDKAYVHLMLGNLQEDYFDQGYHYKRSLEYAPKSRERWVTMARWYEKLGMRTDLHTALFRARECKVQSTGYDYDPWCWSPEFEAWCDRVESEWEVV